MEDNLRNEQESLEKTEQPRDQLDQSINSDSQERSNDSHSPGESSEKTEDPDEVIQESERKELNDEVKDIASALESSVQDERRDIPYRFSLGTLVSTNEILQTQRAYAPHPDYDRAIRQLRKNRLLLLRGEAGIGKRTMAIRLCLEALKSSQVYELSPQVNLNVLSRVQKTTPSPEELTGDEYLSRLLQTLNLRFSEDELRTLCFQLTVDYDSLGGRGKAAKGRELIDYLKRRERIPELLEIGDRLRSDISWFNLSETTRAIRKNIVKDSGYIVEQIGVKEVALNESSSNHLARRLQDNHSYMVVSVHQDVKIDEGVWSAYGIQVRRPAHIDVARKFLASRKEATQKLVENALHLLTDEFSDQLTNSNMAKVVQLARLALRVVKGEISLDDMKAHLELGLFTKASEWFEMHRDTKDIAFLLSLAVYDGMEFSDVKREGEKLTTFFPELVNSADVKNDDSMDMEGVIRESSIFSPIKGLGPGQTEIEQYFEAKFHKTSKSFEYGLDRIDTISLRNPRFGTVVLGRAWDAYIMRDALLQWLREAMSSRDKRMRQQAADAASELAKKSFRPVYNGILRPWAEAEKNTNPARGMLVRVFANLIREPEHASKVLGVLNYWTKSNKRSWWWAAAISYGPVGLKYTDEALENLAILVEVGTRSLRQQACESIGLIFQTGCSKLELAGKVLFALDDWASSDSADLQRCGLTLFLELAETTKCEFEHKQIPMMLHLAVQEPVLCGIISHLLHIAWHSENNKDRTKRLIEVWLRGPTKEKVEDVILRLSFQGTEREQKQFRRQMGIWADHRIKPIPYADILLKTIDQAHQVQSPNHMGS